MSSSNFMNYVCNCTPLPWTLNRQQTNKKLIGKHTMLINYVRYSIIMKAVEKYFKYGDKIIDVGVYPGVIPQMFHEYYPAK